MMTSKKTLLTLLMFLLLTPVFAQPKQTPAASKDCFREWLTVFRSRGAKPVTDGTQEVIITLRGQTSNECFMGKIEVLNGKIVLPLWIQKDDGSYEPNSSIGKKIDPEFASTMTQDELFSITDGMTISFRTQEGDFGRLFFYKFLNDKPKSNKVAPSPSALIKY
jgi:hypothetical protein